MNTEKLEKLKKSLDNQFVPDNMKDKIRAEIKKIEAEIEKESKSTSEIKKEVKEVEKKVEEAIEKGEEKAEEKAEPKKRRGRPAKAKETPAEPKATETTIKKTAMAVAKSIRKDGEKWSDAMKRANEVMNKEKVEAKKTTKSELDRLLARVRKNKSLMSELSGVKDLSRDAVRQAKPVGKRISKTGNVYYEYRANKTDRKTYGKYAFADGGKVEFVKEFTYKDGIQISEGKTDDGKIFYSANVISYPLQKIIPMNESKDYVMQRAKDIYKSMLDYKKTEDYQVYKDKKFELGGSVVTDLAGHQDGTFGVGNHGMLDGFSNTSYTGLVGETGAMSSGELFMDGGAVGMANQQVIDNASQSYVNYYLGEGASAGIFKDGGAIENQYEGKTPAQVWSLWTENQKRHFLIDHFNNFIVEEFKGKNLIDISRLEYKKLPLNVRLELDYHVNKGQYAKGGGVEKRSLKSVIHLVDWKGEGIKKWYLRSYPKDEMGKELNDKVTFKDLWDALNQKKDIYEIIGVADSLIRERLFEYLSLIYNVDYDVVYNKWLDSDDYAKGGEIEFQRSNLRIIGTGIDTNGNRVVKVSIANQRPFSIQTNGNLPNTHRLLRGYDKNTNLYEGEIESMENEIVDYVENYGSPNQKKSLKIYSNWLDKDNYAKGGGVRKMSEWSVSITSEDGNTFDWVGFAKNEDDALYKAEQEAGFESVESGVTEITDSKGKKIEYATGGSINDKTTKMRKQRLKKGDNVFVIGRRWFDRVNGNTYHTAEVEVNGIYVGKSRMTYGYDEQYLETAKEILLQKYDLPTGMNENSPLWRLREYGVVLNKSVIDGKKRDLEVGGFMDGVYAEGGGVRIVNGREYPTGRNWTNEHRHIDKADEREVNYVRKKSFADGGGVDYVPQRIQERLEYLRGEIRKEDISYDEIVELESLREYIAPDDVELLQWVDVEEDEFAKGGKVSPFKNIMETNTITEKEINLIKLRMNNNKVDEDTQEIIDYIWENSPQLTPDQNRKGIDYLRNIWKSPTGKERANNPFGYREKEALETFEYFELRGFYDAGNRHQKYYVPLYICVGAETSFEYYTYGGSINILS